MQPVALRYQAGKLAAYVRTLCQLTHVGAPGLQFPGRDGWLRAVVEDEGLIGVHIHKLQRLRQVARADQDVVDESGVAERANAAIECRAENELIVWLILDDVAQTFQPCALTKGCERLWQLRRLDGGPANDAFHPAGVAGFVGQSQKPARLLKILARLHCDRSRNLGEVETRLQIAGQEVTTKDAHLFVDPAVLLWRVAP